MKKIIQTDWVGLWEQDQPDKFKSKVFNKSDIPPHARMWMCKNRGWTKGSNRPKWVICFITGDTNGEVKTIDKHEKSVFEDDGNYYTQDGERLYTHSEVQRAINLASEDGARGYTDNLVSDYL